MPPNDEPSSDTINVFNGLRPDLEIDITPYLCPMTFVRTRLALDRLQAGQILAVRLIGTEPRTNVPRTAVEQGHTVLGQEERPDGSTMVLIKKATSGS